jgi:hypothetical protein
MADPCVSLPSVPGTALANGDIDRFGQGGMQSVNGMLIVAVAEDGRVGADQDQTITIFTAFTHLVDEVPINEDKRCGRAVPAAVNKVRLPDLR